MKRIAPCLLMVLLAATAAAWAETFYLSPDVPTDLAGQTRLPWEVTRHGSGGYTTMSTLA